MSTRRLLLLAGVLLVIAGAVVAALVLSRDPHAVTQVDPPSTATTVTSTTIEEPMPGTSEIRAGDFDGARSRLQEYIAEDPADIEARYLLATVEEQAGDLDAAVAVFRGILAADPRDFEAHFRIGGILRRQGDLGGAAAEFEESLALNGDFTAARVALAQTVAESGDPNTAIEIYFDVIETQPMGVHLDQIRYALASLLLEVDQPDNAALQLEKALVENPDYPEAKALLEEVRLRGAPTPDLDPAESTSTTLGP